MTTLDAVNELLESIGEPPVTALDTGGTSDEGDAERILDREVKRQLTKGWVANTELDREFTRDGSNEIVLASILTVLGPSRNESRYRNLAIRNGKLYDRDENSFTFAESVKLDVVVDLPLTELPEKLAWYVVLEAAVAYQQYKKRGTIDDAFAKDRRQQAWLEATREDEDLGGVNLHNTIAHRLRIGDRDDYGTAE